MLQSVTVNLTNDNLSPSWLHSIGVYATPPIMTTVSSSSLGFCHQAGESDDALEVNDLIPQNPREAASMPVSAILN